MAKYQHTEDTKIVLDDLENRLTQLIEVNELHLGGDEDDMIIQQNHGMGVALTLIGQVRKTGHIQRGTPIIPDQVEPRAKTKWNKRPQLGLSKLMQLANQPNKEEEE